MHLFGKYGYMTQNNKLPWKNLSPARPQARKHAQPKVNNKAPLLNVGAFYKPGLMKKNAAMLSQIEKDNFTLIKHINIIYRTHGKTDSSQPLSMNNRMPNKTNFVKRNKQICKENIELLTKIVYAKPRIYYGNINKHYNKYIQELKFMSKYPKYYEKKIDEFDPLITGLLKSVQIKKSKCYVDVRDCTADTPMGRLTIELYDGVVPETAANFAALCRGPPADGPCYAGTQFFRIVPGLFCLGGDVEYSVGVGGQCAARGRRYIADENYALSHNATGTLSMYNFEKDQNASQFLITFKPLTSLDGKYVVFGRIIRGINTLKSIEDLGFKSGKPKHKIVIDKCGTLD